MNRPCGEASGLKFRNIPCSDRKASLHIVYIKPGRMFQSNINRREFIKNVGAGTGLLVSAAGFPLSSLATEKPVRLGFVGVGGRGIGMLKIALALEGVEVVAI